MIVIRHLARCLLPAIRGGFFIPGRLLPLGRPLPSLIFGGLGLVNETAAVVVQLLLHLAVNVGDMRKSFFSGKCRCVLGYVAYRSSLPMPSV